MIRLHCDTIDRDIITGLGSVTIENRLGTTFAHVTCPCGALVTLEGGHQTCHA